MMLVCHNVNVDVRVVAGEFVRAEMEIPAIKAFIVQCKKVLVIVRLHPKFMVNIDGHRYKNYIANVLMKSWIMLIIVTTMLLIVLSATSNYVVSE